jgi:hypothetical protein
LHSKKIADVDISEILKLYHSLPENAFRSVQSNNPDKRYYKLADKSIIQEFLNDVAYLINKQYPFKGISQENLVRVHADYLIPEHRDGDQYNDQNDYLAFPERYTKEYDRLKEGYGIQRFHLPLIVDLENVYFLIEGEEVRMQPGELWWLDHYREHAVINNGNVERVHFMIDTYTTQIDQSTDWE